MKLLLDILTHVMTIIVVCYRPNAGFGEPVISFLVQSHQELQKKKESSQEIYPNN